MADGIVQLQPNSTGPKVDTSELTVGPISSNASASTSPIRPAQPVLLR